MKSFAISLYYSIIYIRIQGDTDQHVVMLLGHKCESLLFVYERVNNNNNNNSMCFTRPHKFHFLVNVHAQKKNFVAKVKNCL